MNEKLNKKTKKRLDIRLVENGLAPSRERAAALILAGGVFVNGKRAAKAGAPVAGDSKIELHTKDIPYVSRGGVKLEGALASFQIDVTSLVGFDIGASTGGFTDCLLIHGAQKVYAIDVGYGQFSWKLRQDQRVQLFERKNIRFVTPEEFSEKGDIAVIDVSFISLKLVLPAVISLLKPGGELLALIKPQFELSRGDVGKGGVVKDPQKHQIAISSVCEFTKEAGLKLTGVEESILPGPKGNREFFLYAKTGEPENPR
ncbi:MAG: TlyA family RNA methyltransferase [Nitrospinota bacterium]